MRLPLTARASLSQPVPRAIRAGLLLGVALAASPAAADTIVLKNGKTIENVTVSRNDDEFVVINRFGSRHPDMKFEVEDRDRIAAGKVAEVIVADPPLVEARKLLARSDLTVAEHLAAAKMCGENKLKAERLLHLQRALMIEPANAEALKAYGKSKWASFAKTIPHVLKPEMCELELSFIAVEDETELRHAWKAIERAGGKRELEYLQRARRSAKQPKGRRDKVPLTLRSDEAPGATYCINVPERYDPLQPTPLVVGLHGGGRGGKDGTLVTGSGESAMNFYSDQSEKHGAIVVCPTALRAPWANPANGPFLDALLDEMRMLFNVDESRIYLTGHSMGGYGTYHWSGARADVWAAVAPCAGGGGLRNGIGTDVPIYIYHGADDRIVGPSSDRSNAKQLVGNKKANFVYTEFDDVGHGFPKWVRDDIFNWLLGHARGLGKKRSVGPESSFLRKVSKDEIKTFDDPGKLPGGGGKAAPKLRDLIAALGKGGGGGVEATLELANMKDEATVKAVAKLLGSKKSSVDTRVLAARSLGMIGLPAAIKSLTRALGDEDYRVLDSATSALGQIGTQDAALPLVKAGKAMGKRFEDSYIDSQHIVFTEYTVRLESFARFLDAVAQVGHAETLFPVVQRQVIANVYLPVNPYTFRKDPRFDHIPPQQRVKLMGNLRDCLLKLGDARGAPQLELIAESPLWKDEPRLVQAAKDAAAEANSQ